MNLFGAKAVSFLNTMNNFDYVRDESFASLPDWQKGYETLVRPIVENKLNEMIEHHNSAENQVQDEGIELAIQRYGLRPASDDGNDVQPSTSQGSAEPDTKKRKTEPNTEDVLVSAVCSAIAQKGLMRFQS